MMKTLTGTTTLDQSGFESNDKVMPPCSKKCCLTTRYRFGSYSGRKRENKVVEDKRKK